MISEKVNQIGASPTLKISAKAKAMRAEGIDVIDLSLGEPDFPTPENVKAAGVKAIQENFTKYTEIDGIPALRKAIIQRLKDDH
ncbi:MAG: aminotransferase class I/II-fold pyridoxal phosphate-dependent enzyme, partial [Candidatus Aminicenantes bacterium]|nr:aminotransferase class I/II-fold pyridoxal phosphate-dependent enzyme [Candidatus Aminicenantes bacterium]